MQKYLINTGYRTTLWARCIYLIEVSVKYAAAQIGSCTHKFEEPHKVIAVECCKGLHSKINLSRLPYLFTELLHLTALTKQIHLYPLFHHCKYIYNKCVLLIYILLDHELNP